MKLRYILKVTEGTVGVRFTGVKTRVTNVKVKTMFKAIEDKVMIRFKVIMVNICLTESRVRFKLWSKLRICLVKPFQ